MQNDLYTSCASSLIPLLKQMYKLNSDKTAKPMKLKIAISVRRGLWGFVKPHRCSRFG